MHCPQCGQEQISDEMRFCKSCGFRLAGVKELLAADGISPAVEMKGPEALQSPRRKGVRLGVMLLFVSIVLMPVGIMIGEPRGSALPAIFFMAGLMRILYAVIFQQRAPKKQKRDRSLPYVAPATTNQLRAETAAPALPPSQSIPVDLFVPPRVDTAKMGPPPSVTEHTTKLLDKSQDSH